MEANPDDASLRRMLGVSCIRLGDVLGNPNVPNLGDPKGAIASYRRGLEIAQELAARDRVNAQFRHDVAVADDRVGDMFGLATDYHQAVVHHQVAAEALRRLVEQDPADVGAKRDLAVALGKVGEDLAGQKDYAGALRTFGEVLRRTTALAEADPGTLLYATDRAEACYRLAETSLRAGDLETARAYGAKGVAIVQALLAKDPGGQRPRKSDSGSSTGGGSGRRDGGTLRGRGRWPGGCDCDARCGRIARQGGGVRRTGEGRSRRGQSGRPGSRLPARR